MIGSAMFLPRIPALSAQSLRSLTGQFGSSGPALAPGSQTVLARACGPLRAFSARVYRGFRPRGGQLQRNHPADYSRLPIRSLALQPRGGLLDREHDLIAGGHLSATRPCAASSGPRMTAKGMPS